METSTDVIHFNLPFLVRTEEGDDPRLRCPVCNQVLHGELVAAPDDRLYHGQCWKPEVPE